MNSMIYKVGFFVLLFSTISLTMNNDFPMARFIKRMAQRGECQILSDGTVFEYPSGKKMGKIEDGRFIAVDLREYEKEVSQRNAKKE